MPYYQQYGYGAMPQAQATHTLGYMTVNAAPPVNTGAVPGMNPMNNMINHNQQPMAMAGYQHQPPPPPPPVSCPQLIHIR